MPYYLLWTSIQTWFAKKKNKESFYAMMIFYLSLTAVVTGSWGQKFSADMVESQLRWTHSIAQENYFSSLMGMSKILEPMLDSGILKSSLPEEFPQATYNAYLAFSDKEFSSEEEYREELQSVAKFSDLREKVSDDEVEKQHANRMELSGKINLYGAWSRLLNGVSTTLNIITAFLAIKLTLSLYKSDDEAKG